MWVLHILICTPGKHLSDHSQGQPNTKRSLVKELSGASWQRCSSAECQTSTPAAPLILAFHSVILAVAQVPQTPCTWAPRSCAFGMAAVYPLLAQSLGEHPMCYIHGKSRVAGKCMCCRYFCCAFKLLCFGSWLNLADFSEKLTRRICSAPPACPAAGTIVSRQPHKPFKITIFALAICPWIQIKVLLEKIILCLFFNYYSFHIASPEPEITL